MNRLSILPLFGFCVFCLALVSGCGSTSLRDNSDVVTIPPGPWHLIAAAGDRIDPATMEITAEFQDGRISGKSAVNRYFGPFTLGSGGTINFGMMASTKMAGPEPLMQAESEYMSLLDQVAFIRVSNSRLSMLNNMDEPILVFEHANETR